jgi:hypothetical protein
MAVPEKYERIVTSILSVESLTNGDNDLPFNYTRAEESPRKYLRFWGNHYPYLGANRNSEPRWLPIPENSDAQKMIRDLNRKPQF